MIRPGLSLTASLFVLAAAVNLAGELPGPGLEVFDNPTGAEAAAPTVIQPAFPTAQPGFDGTTLVPPERPPVIVPDAPQPAAVPFPADQFVPGRVQPAADPFAQEPSLTEPYYAEPYADSSAQEGFIGEPYTDPDYVDPLAQQPAPVPAADTAPQGESVVYPPDPIDNTIDAINYANPSFPGLAEQVQARNLRGIADIVWQVSRERRIINATMARGPGGSAGIATQYDLQRVSEAAHFTPGVPSGDTPLMAAYRINTIIDALESPVVDDYGMGSLMEAILVRLYSDIYAVRNALAADCYDDGVFQELQRTYFRAVTTCDWYNFPRAGLIADINAVATRAGGFFYPDGASTAGDVAGVTGNLFHSLLMLDAYSRGDTSFRRETGSLWRTLEQPSRFVLDTALPDGTAPRFGPRGSRELGQLDMNALAAMFPKPQPRNTRIGLAASASYPPVSNQSSYGGIYVSRSGGEPDSRYLAMRFGPYGIQNNVPGHFDFGSIVLMSRNIRFIVDGGGYGGDAALPEAHSVLLLEGVSIDPASYNAPGQPSDAIWRTNGSIDYLTDRALFTDGKSWQRAMVYVKNLPGETRNDYWLVLDSVDMNGDPQPRQARIRYQLAPGLQAYHDGSGVVASAGFMDGSSLRFFAINPSAETTVSEGSMGLFPSYVHDTSGGRTAAPSVNVARTLTGNDTTITMLYPAMNMQHRPVRIERDADIVRGRTGALVIDHGNERVDVVAWSPPGEELVTPTLNLQLSADLAVFRLRKGKIVRIDFVNLERFQAKEPDGGLWSMRVNGPAQTITIEPEARGGWQILADPANMGSAAFIDVNLGPAISRSRFSIRPGEIRIVAR